MSPEFLSKWEHILEDVEKNKIPIQFIKKLIIKLNGIPGKRQHTINIEKMMNGGVAPDQVEEILDRKLEELDEYIISVDFVLNVKAIAETVQPMTDSILSKL